MLVRRYRAYAGTRAGHAPQVSCRTAQVSGLALIATGTEVTR